MDYPAMLNSDGIGKSAIPAHVVSHHPGPIEPARLRDSVRVLVTDRLHDLVALWPRSNDLGDARCHVFQCADVLEVWLDTIGAACGIRPCFVAVLGDDGPQMLLPMGIERRAGLRVLTFLDGSVSDYNAPVLFSGSQTWDARAFDGLWRKIVSALPSFDVAVLEKMPAQVQDFVNPLMFLSHSRHPVSGHRLTLTGSWKDYEARRLPRREDGRRKFKKLSQFGRVTFDIASSSETIGAYFDAMIQYKARKFAETRVPGFEVPGKLSYFREATRRLARSGPVHLSALKVADDVVASHWGLVAGDHFYHMMPGYADGHWQRHSPGRLLNDQLIRYGFERGLRVFDFGIGDEPYKHEYCDVTVDLHDHVMGMTATGKLYLRWQAGLGSLRQTACWQFVRPFKWVVLRTSRRWTEAVVARLILMTASLSHRVSNSHVEMTTAVISSL